MGILDDLAADVGSRFDVGAQARPFLAHVVRFITEQSGGIAGFINRLKADGMGDLTSAWVGSQDAAPMTVPQTERAFGASLIPTLTRSLGLGSSVVTGALAYALPKVVSLLTPNGVVPTGVPPAAVDFLGRATGHPAAAATAAGGGTGLRKLMWPALVLLGLAGLAWYFLSSPQDSRVATTPVTQAPAVQPRLALSHDDGTVSASGVVRDEATRTSILDTLAAVFGSGNVRSDLRVDPAAGPAPWLERLRAAVEKLNVPGLQALFEGDAIQIGGLIPDVDRDRLLAELKSLFGDRFSFAALNDQVSLAVRDAAARARAALAGLSPGFGGTDVVEALNLTIINFPTGSAQVPSFNRALLQDAAKAMRQLPAGTVIEIGGHTDSTGDPTANVQLSKQRAEQVREVLIAAGVDPALLTARGYGSERSVASNDTPEGRFQNRRIEYALVR